MRGELTKPVSRHALNVGLKLGVGHLDPFLTQRAFLGKLEDGSMRMGGDAFAESLKVNVGRG
jgi:hypothetical protein